MGMKICPQAFSVRFTFIWFGKSKMCASEYSAQGIREAFRNST
jgi:hypothetical protein